MNRSARLPSPAPTSEVLLRASGLSAGHGRVQVLESVSLDVRVGELVVVAGPNGAGKTTLLSVLAGELDPSRGSVELDHAPVRSWSVTELAMRRAVLPQHVSIAFPFTVLEVVRMGRAPWARTPLAGVDDEVVEAAIADAGVEHLAHRALPTLSGGERARAALARVLAQATRVLMLDEPTASLDLHHQELVLERARRHAERGGAVVAVLHDLTQAAAHADRIVLMADGRVVADGPPAVVLDAERLSQVYRNPVDVFAHPRSGLPVVTPAPTRQPRSENTLDSQVLVTNHR